MGFFKAIGQTMKLIGASLSETIDVATINSSINEKRSAIKQIHRQTGNGISEEGYPDFMESLVRSIRRERTELDRLQHEMDQLEQQLDLLRQRLKEVSSGFFDASPQVVDLQNQISSLKSQVRRNEDAIREKGDIILDLLEELGEKAYNQKFRVDVYRDFYQEIDHLLREISQLEVEAQSRKQKGEVEKDIIKSNIKQAFVTERNTSSDQFYTKLVGVTFDNRQNLIMQLRAGEELFLQQDKNNQYDRNAIAVLNKNGNILGFIQKDLASRIGKNLDLGWTYSVEVSNITGGGTLNYGVNIAVKIQSRPARQTTNYFDSYDFDLPDDELDYPYYRESICDGCSGAPDACSGCEWGNG